MSLEGERGGVGGVKAAEGVVWRSPGSGLCHQKLVLQKCCSKSPVPYLFLLFPTGVLSAGEHNFPFQFLLPGTMQTSS